MGYADDVIFNYLRQGFVAKPKSPKNANLTNAEIFELEMEASASATKNLFAKPLEEKRLIYEHYLPNDTLFQNDIANLMEGEHKITRRELLDTLLRLVKGSAKALLRYSAMRFGWVADSKATEEVEIGKRDRQYTFNVAREVVFAHLNELVEYGDSFHELIRDISSFVLQQQHFSNQKITTTLDGKQMNSLGCHLSQTFRALVGHLKDLLRKKDSDDLSSFLAQVKQTLGNSSFYADESKQKFPDIVATAVRAFFQYLGPFALELKKDIKDQGKALTPFLPELSRQFSAEIARMVTSNICDFAIRAIQANLDYEYLNGFPKSKRTLLSKSLRLRIALAVIRDNSDDLGDERLNELRVWLESEFNKALGGRTFNEAMSCGSAMPLMKLFVHLHRYHETCSDRFDQLREHHKADNKVLPRQKRYLLLPLGDFSTPPAAFAKGIVLAKGARAAADHFGSDFTPFLTDQKKANDCKRLLNNLAARIERDKANLDDFCAVFAPTKYAFHFLQLKLR